MPYLMNGILLQPGISFSLSSPVLQDSPQIYILQNALPETPPLAGLNPSITYFYLSILHRNNLPHEKLSHPIFQRLNSVSLGKNHSPQLLANNYIYYTIVFHCI